MKGKCRKITLTSILFMFFITISMSLNVRAEDTNAGDITVLDDGTVVQAYSDITGFRSSGTYTKPDAPSEYSSYIFSGWYLDENGAKALTENEANNTKSGAYAKFVPKDVLSIKAQVSANLLNPDTEDDATGAIRFVTTVDSKKYSKVGFIFDIDGGTQDYEVANEYVYTELFAVDPVTGEKGEVEKITPEETFCSLSKYFKTCTFYNIPQSQYDVKITATPFWVTVDGTYVEGVTDTKTINDGKISGWAYVSTEGSDDNPGTEEKPYATLNKALEKVKDGGVVCVLDEYVADSTFVWEDHAEKKPIYITGGKIDFSVLETVEINDAVTFTGTELNFYPYTSASNSAAIFANGNKLKIDEDVTFTKDVIIRVYGGANGSSVASTDVTLLAGNYIRIFGGGIVSTEINVEGTAKLYIAGNVNNTTTSITSPAIYGGGNTGTIKNTDVYIGGYANNNATKVSIYGGSYAGTVTENTNVTIEGNAKFLNTYGGGFGKANVEGTANVTIGGTVNVPSASVYGASVHKTNAGTVNDTNVIIKDDAIVKTVYGGGASSTTTLNNNMKVTGIARVKIMENAQVESVYGGGYYSKTENTFVNILGGTISNKLYGGSNGAAVTGKSVVKISPDATIPSDNDSVYAVSTVATTTGQGIFIVNDYENNDNLSNIRATDSSGVKTYDYLVRTSKGGDVDVVGNTLCIKPAEGFKATVTDSIESETKEYTSESNHTLPSFTDEVSQITITVDFERMTPATVYISEDGSDDGLGTSNEPYATLNRAIEEVKGGGTVYVMDEYVVDSEFAWENHSDTGMIYITGDILDFSAISSTINIYDAVTFTDIKLNFAEGVSVFANGNTFKIDENVTYTSEEPIKMYGGANGSAVASTDVTLLAGNYSRIFGGGVVSSGTNVEGTAKLYIAGNVNNSVDDTNVAFYGGGEKGTIGSTDVYVGGKSNKDATDVAIYGGGYNETIEGDTNLTIERNANFKLAYGGGYRATISGTANITIGGDVSATEATVYGGTYYTSNAYSVKNTNVHIKDNAKVGTLYGGGRNKVKVTGTTNVKITDNAEIGTLYGGSNTGATENTSVEILGGTITEKIYGGSNGNTVTGTTTVKISPNAVIPDVADSIYSVSNTTADTETGIFIINDYRNNDNKYLIAASNYTEGISPYDYRVDVSSGGTVNVVDGKLSIQPDEGFKAVVTDSVDSDTAEYETVATHNLPTLSTDETQIIITVDFEKIESEVIYLSEDGSDAEGDGTEGKPYATLNYALSQADNGDTISVVNIYTVDSPSDSWVAHGKDVTITGGTLDFTTDASYKTVNIQDAVTFSGIHLKFNEETSIYANGNRFKIDSDATVSGVLLVYGAGNGGTVDSTDVTLLSGDYKRVFGAGVNATINGNTNLHISGDVNKTREFASNSFVIYGAGNKGTVKGNTNVYVGGNVNSELNLTASDVARTVLYGGSSRGTVEGSTYVTVEGNAQFSYIYGGGQRGTISGDTNVTIRGTVNSSMDNWTDITDHDAYASVYGGSLVDGSNDATTVGNTNVTVDGDAQFMYIYGGNRCTDVDYATASTIESTNVTITENSDASRIMSVYGGGYLDETGNTKVVINAGEIQQIFGGCRSASVNGNTDVQVLGGTVTRRIYGGCYNDFDEDTTTWESSHYVTGYTNVTIDEAADIALTYRTTKYGIEVKSDNSIYATSRYSSDYSSEVNQEVGVFIFSNYTNDEDINNIGYTDGIASNVYKNYFSNTTHHYLIKATAGGFVCSENGTLNIIPDEGYTATVSYGDSSTVFITQGTYALPTDVTLPLEITVTFEKN